MDGCGCRTKRFMFWGSRDGHDTGGGHHGMQRKCLVVCKNDILVLNLNNSRLTGNAAFVKILCSVPLKEEPGSYD